MDSLVNLFSDEHHDESCTDQKIIDCRDFRSQFKAIGGGCNYLMVLDCDLQVSLEVYGHQ